MSPSRPSIQENNKGKVFVSKKKDRKGTEPVARTPEQHKRHREYEAMSPEEKKKVHRDRFVSWMEWLQQPGPKIMINGKPPKGEYVPMSKEQAILNIAAYDGDIPNSPEQKLGIYLMNRKKKETED